MSDIDMCNVLGIIPTGILEKVLDGKVAENKGEEVALSEN